MPDLIPSVASLKAAALRVVPTEIIAALTRAKRVWILPHERPDGDALGAALGLSAILVQRGTETAVISADAPPAVYDVIPTINTVRLAPPHWLPDLVVLVDCGDLQRTGRGAEHYAALPTGTPLLVIDHHLSNVGSATASELVWIDPGAAATCEMVTLIGLLLDTRFDGPDAVASALATGIVMDTATFQHGNTTPRTLEVGALLLAAGAPIAEISRRIYRSRPMAQTRLHALVLSTIETSDGGRTVAARMHTRDLQSCGAVPEHSEGIVDALAQIVEADVALFFKEESATTTRLSVRTKANAIDATTIVAVYGGGGHARAAGATIALPLDAAVPAVLEVVATLRLRQSAR